MAGFDRAQFEADGFWLWEGIMLPGCRERLTAALKDVQQQQDRLIMDPAWDEMGAADFAALGLSPPERRFTREERAEMLGRSQGDNQSLTQGIEPLDEAGRLATYTPHPRTNRPDAGLIPEHKYRQRMPVGDWGGVWPEHFPAGYNEHILDMVTHPQMLAIHRLTLGEELRYDHCVALNRRCGYEGGSWHSHGYTENNAAPAATLPALGMVMTLACEPHPTVPLPAAACL